MFERFTEDARQTVVEAQAEARRLGHGWIGTEHLMLATLRQGSPLCAVLEALGVTYEGVRADLESRSTEGAGAPDAALRDLGIDVDEVRRRVEASFGPGALDAAPTRRHRWSGRRRHGRHIPFTPEARKALEESLRESVRLGSGDIRSAHILLGLLAAGGPASAILHRLGVPPETVRRAVLRQLGTAA